MTTKINLDDLKASIDLRSYVAGVIGTPAKQTREYWQWNSPFRSEDTPSFTVWADHFYDFGSDDHGSVIDFVMEYDGCDLKEAIEKLSGNVPVQHKPAPPKQPIQLRSPSIPMQTVEVAYSHIEEGLPFFHRRCISTEKSYESYLGVKPQHKTYYKDSKGNLHCFTARRYAVPNIFNGQVRAINYRRDDDSLLDYFWRDYPQFNALMDDLKLKYGEFPSNEQILKAIGGGKYEQEKGSLHRPFNVQAIAEVQDGKPVPRTNLPYVLIHAETKEYDTLALADHGYPTVGITLNAEIEASLPGIFSKIPLLYIVRDADGPGLEKAERLARAIGRGRIIKPLDGAKDTGEILQAGLLSKWMNTYGLEPLR